MMWHIPPCAYAVQQESLEQTEVVDIIRGAQAVGAAYVVLKVPPRYLRNLATVGWDVQVYFGPVPEDREER